MAASAKHVFIFPYENYISLLFLLLFSNDESIAIGCDKNLIICYVPIYSLHYTKACNEFDLFPRNGVTAVEICSQRWVRF